MPLTETGRRQAERLGATLEGRSFTQVLSSPLSRAYETCRLAGYGDAAMVEPDLQEWDYGEYEGLTTKQIRERSAGWSLWVDGVPSGETIAEVAARADAVIAQASEVNGDVALFAHGHILRVLAARWLGLEPAAARLLALHTASLSVLAYERNTRVIQLWNWLELDEMPRS